MDREGELRHHTVLMMENLATTMERECDEALGLFNQDLMWVEIGKNYKLWYILSMDIF